MVKLFAMVLAISDTGSITMTTLATDFPDPSSCARAVEQMYRAPRAPLQLGGHTISVKIAAECLQ